MMRAKSVLNAAALFTGFLVTMNPALASEADSTIGWRYHGATRAAVGLTDTSSRSGVTFATTDLLLAFSASTKKFSSYTQLELAHDQITNEVESNSIGARQASVAFENAGKLVSVRVGRLLMSGVPRYGAEAATNWADEGLGRIDGLSVVVGKSRGPFEVGLVAGNTLGQYGATSEMAESAMNINRLNPSETKPPKSARAGTIFAGGCFAEVCAEVWYQREKDFFDRASKVSREDVAAGSNPNGLYYERMQRAEGGINYAAKKLNVGAWYQKTWLRNPHVGSLNGSSSKIATSSDFAGNSKWIETTGLGVEYAIAAPIAEESGKILPTPFIGMTLGSTRKASDGFAKGGDKAKKEDAEDIKEVALSLGWRELPATISLTAVHGMTEGRVFSTKNGTPNVKDRRTVVYSAVTFAM